MIDGKKILAIVPARSGSKRVKNKNIRDVEGLPLIGWTLKDLKKSKYIDHSYVSTDSVDIQNVAQAFGIDSEPLRTDEFSTDTASSIDVVLDIILNLKKDYDIVILLQPTSPLRKIQSIDEAIEFYLEKKARSVISVCETECHPSWTTALDGDKNLNDLIRNIQTKRSQDLETHYRLNGAIYISSVENLKVSKSFFSPDKSYAYIMSKMDSVDIDTEDDLMLAKMLIKIDFLNEN